MTSRRTWLVALGATAVTGAVAGPKPGRIPHVGYLSTGSIDDKEAFLEAFKDGLRELGYVDGRNVVIDVRWAGDLPGQFPKLAASLVRDSASAIVTTCVPSTRAAKGATSSIPIVMSVDQDPVAAGLVTSLARPGANITGTATLFEELIGKWLELARTTFPGIREVSLLSNPDALTDRYFWARFEGIAKRLGVEMTQFGANDVASAERAFQAMAAKGARPTIVMTDAFFATRLPTIVAEAARHRIPAIYGFTEFAEAGGLMSYGISFREYYKGVARYVDAVLNGVLPADIPVQQPTRIGLVVNRRTAGTLGLALPEAILQRADRVIG